MNSLGGYFYAFQGPSDIKIGESRVNPYARLKAAGHYYKIIFLVECNQINSLNTEKHFKSLLKEFSITKYTGSIGQIKSKEYFDKNCKELLITKLYDWMDQNECTILHMNLENDIYNFKSILKERGSGHTIEFLMKLETGEKTWEPYENVPEEFILSEGFKTMDQRGIPDPPEDESDDDWEPGDESDEEPEEEYYSSLDSESEVEFTEESKTANNTEYVLPINRYYNLRQTTRSSKRPRHN